MLKTFYQKIKHNHLLLMILCCLIPVILIIGFSSLFKEGSNYWWWLIILLCPVLHIWMMKGYKHNKKSELYQCQECGLRYQEKEWAEKCQAWCKEHQSCNLEITKHALKK